MESLTPAESALQLLFKKLHPHLEDAAHALDSGLPPEGLERLHTRLIKAREKTCEALDELADACDEPLAELLSELSGNLTPVGENYQQSLTLTQLCLEEAPADLLPFVPAGRIESSPWGPRMNAFLALVQAPALQAKARWDRIAPEIGEETED